MKNMGRNIAIGFIAFIVLVLVGCWIFIATLDINKYLNQITQQLTTTLGRSLTIAQGKLDVSFKGIGLRLENIRLADDPIFSDNAFVSIKQAWVEVDVKDLLLKRTLSVKAIEIIQPQVQVIRRNDGQLNINSLLSSNATPTDPIVSSHQEPSASQQVQGQGHPQAVKALPVNVNIDKLAINDLTLIWDDRQESMPMLIKFEHLNLQLTQVSLNKPFDVVLSVALFSNEPNVKFALQALVNLPESSLELSKGQLTLDVSTLDWQMIKTNIPALAKQPIPQELSGLVTLDIAKVVLSDKGVSQLNAGLKLSSGKVLIFPLATPLSDIQFNADITSTAINYTLDMNLNSSKLAFKGDVQNYLNPNEISYRLSGGMGDLNLDGLLHQDLGVVLVGLAGMDMNYQGRGINPTDALNALKGSLNVSLKEVQVKNVNVLRMMLAPALEIPVLNVVLPSLLDAVLNSEQTRINTAFMNTFTDQGVLSIDDFHVLMESIEFKGQGDLDLMKMALAMDIQTLFSPSLSEKVIAQASQLQALVDNGQLQWPGKIRGIIPQIQYQPDTNYITKKMLVQEGVGALDKVLQKNPEVRGILNAVLGPAPDSKDQESQMVDPSVSDQQQQQERHEELLNNVLDKIF